MKCVLGFSLFMIGIGMLIKLFLPDSFWVIALMLGVIIAGYVLFIK